MPAAAPPPAPEEVLLAEEERRTNLFPIRHPAAWARYKQALACLWVPGEVDLSHDKEHWRDKLNADERHFLSHVLAFFANADGIVNENLAERFSREVAPYEVKCFYDLQKMIENIHSEMYSLLIDTYIDDEAERDRLFHALDHVPCVAKKAEWARRWIESQESFATRLIAFAVVEGIFFSGSFCAIFWLKRRGIMPGLCVSNTLIARDEGMHQDFAAFLYAEMLQETLEEDKVQQIVDEAVELEAEFCTSALPVSLIGMNAGDMIQYIRFVADRLLTQLRVPKLYHVTNPFDWMELIALENKTNFFEQRVSEYQKAGARGATGDGGTAGGYAFSTDEAF